MGQGDRGREGKHRRKRNVDDGFRVTFGWAEDANSEPEQEVAFTGEELDIVIAYCMQLTKRGAQVLEGLEIQRIRLADLAPEKVKGGKLFWSNAELMEWCNEEGNEPRGSIE